MIRKLQMAVSAILLSALAVYGFAQRPDSRTPANESNIALERHEARVVKALGLSAKQKGDYEALKSWVKSESAKLAGMSSGKAERGREINTQMHAGMKKIFTPAQYDKYKAMWAPVDFSGGQGVMASGTPFGGTDEAIVTYLKPTSAQWAQYREYLRENEIKNEQYKQLFKEDRNRGAMFGHEWAAWTRVEMRRILGEDKYYEWIRLWDQVMSPYLANGANYKGAGRTATGGTTDGGIKTAAGKIGG